MTTTREQFETKASLEKKEGFRKWMQEPMTRALLAGIPPCEHLEIVLEAAFGVGFDRGSGATSIAFIEAMFKDHR